MSDDRNEDFVVRFIHSRVFMPMKLGLSFIILSLVPRPSSLASAADLPPSVSSSTSVLDAGLLTAPDVSSIEEARRFTKTAVDRCAGQIHDRLEE